MRKQIIQRLAPTEWRRFRAIRMTSLADAPNAFGSTLTDAQTRNETGWRHQLEQAPTFVAVIGSKDVGVVRGIADDDDPSTAFLISMWVAPFYRVQGVAQSLIEAVVAWARANGFTKLVLDVADDNIAAVNLYEKAGFQATGETGTLPPPRQHIREHRRMLVL